MPAPVWASPWAVSARPSGAHGRRELLGRLSISDEAARRVTRRSAAVALLFGCAALWQFLPSAARTRLDPQGPRPEVALTQKWQVLEGAAAGIHASASVEAVDLRRLQTATQCPVGQSCCAATVKEEFDLFLSHTGHLTTWNCNSGKVCAASGKEWMLIFYIFGVLYMFVALAIVCEEFFVPALEYFVEDYQISMDVAGATFMAAGGSMPELFTSFIGTFKESDIGMAAIVGSAVFNVLFVIATCAVASTEVLLLTWWPLARDCSYYIFTLVTLAIFFKGSSANKIQPWEASILLVEYVGYCTLMKFNERIHAWILSKMARPKIHVQEPETGDTSLWAAVPQGGTPVQAVSPGVEGAKDEKDRINASFKSPSTFRQSINALMTQNETITETAGMAAVTKLTGGLRELFDTIDKDKSGIIDEAEFSTLLHELGVKNDSDNLETTIRTLQRLSDNGKINFATFKKWFLASEVRIEVKMCRVFDSFDHNKNGTIERDEVRQVLLSLGHTPGEEDINRAIAEMVSVPEEAPEPEVQVFNNPEDPTPSPSGVDTKDRASVSFAQFSTWYKKSAFWQEKQRHNHTEEQVAEGYFNLDKPENGSASSWAWYVVTYPICAAMFVTMPDVRKPGTGSVLMAVVEFFLSLCWIAFFSLCLVEWTEITSNTIGVPVPVAGLTVLAAGTSIPDLLSSYIVAKQGQGDMAVSSSIGSNIFDVTVGLPLPWLLFSIVKNKDVAVGTDSLGISIIVLTLMITAVIITIMAMRWRMTKTLGYVMFALYVLFLVQALLQQMPEGDPVVPAPF